MVHSFPTRRSSDLTRRAWVPRRAGWRRPAASPPCSRPVPRSEEHTSERQSHHPISYAVFCLKKKNTSSKAPLQVALSRAPPDPAGGAAPRLAACRFFFFNDTATTEIYTGWYTLSLHDALPL